MAESESLNEHREFLEGFIADSREMLDEVEPILVELQQAFETEGQVDRETLNAVFRLFHSIKGAAGFLNLENVSNVTHAAETFLNHLREGRVELDDTRMDLIFKAADFIRRLLEKVEEEGKDGGVEPETEDIIQGLKSAGVTGMSDFPPGTVDPQPVDPDSGSEDPEEIQLVVTPEMKKQFIEESFELLDSVEQALLALENAHNSSESLGHAFRCLHSFKGNCGFFGYRDLERLSHKSETVLDWMKKGKAEVNGDNIGTLLRIVDTLRTGISGCSQGESGDIKGCDLLLNLLDDMIPASKQAALSSGPQPIGEILIERGDVTQEAVGIALEMQQRPLGEILVDMGRVSPGAVQSALSVQEKQGKKRLERRDIRVDLDKVNELNDLVGELVTAQAMVIRNPDLEGHEFENFEKAAHHLQQVTSTLQDVAMSLRMVPVSGLFRKMMRLVHDLSRKSGKKVNLEMTGEETEMDKTVIELISDPLVHIIRNAVDHGIEPPEVRKRAGKAPVGTVFLEAMHEAGEVWIKVGDDGRGLDKEKIRAKGIEKGLIREGDALKDEEIYRLIFEPGFSTAEKITDISGRGVGMDVVGKNIEQLSGRVDVQSTPGQGTTIILRIPLTLAIIEGMLVRSGEARYVIPLSAIRESFKPESSNVVSLPGGQNMVRVREDLIQVARLVDLFHLGDGNGKGEEEILVILDDRGKSFGLLVNEILGQMETVIKGLPRYIGAVKGVSGCTILGDGDVSLILDAGGVIKRAGL